MRKRRTREGRAVIAAHRAELDAAALADPAVPLEDVAA
jgi:hypothetical protein